MGETSPLTTLSRTAPIPGSLEAEAMRMSGDNGAIEYWFNVKTGEVEEGHQSSWEHLMGPYPTREAAAKALETAREKSRAWDDADRDWKGDD